MLTVDWPAAWRLLTFTVPIRLAVPGVRVVETACALVAAVGISRRMLAKRISSTRLFFMKNRAVAVLNLTVPECQSSMSESECHCVCIMTRSIEFVFPILSRIQSRRWIFGSRSAGCPCS